MKRDIKNLETQHWKRIKDPKQTEKCRISRHKDQAQEVICTIEPIVSLLGDDSFMKFGSDILWGKQTLKTKTYH